MTAQQWQDDIPPEIPRDQWKRPLIIPPAGGKPVGYTRASTMGGYLDDTTGLDRWKQRGVAAGLAMRQKDLLLQVVSLGPEPDKRQPNLHRRWVRDLQSVCDQARETAGASSKSTIGTALHALTDRLERGLDIGPVPDFYQAHLKSYAEATAPLTAVEIEQFVVCDELQAAGTFDRLYRVEGHPKLVIGDTKTGDVSRALKIAVQETVYARGSLYDATTGARSSLGDVDTERGLIVALNADTGLCELLWVDLMAGYHAAKVAADVRQVRRYRNLTEPFNGAPTPAPAPEQSRDLTAEAEAALTVAIAAAKTPDELVLLWQKAGGGTAGGGAWKDTHTQLAAARKRELLHRHLTVVS